MGLAHQRQTDHVRPVSDSDPPSTAGARAPLLPIFLIVLVDVLGLTIVLPLIAPYAEKFGATPFVASLLFPSYALCQMLAGPALGRLSDERGRKPILLASQLGTFVGFLMIAGAQSLWMVFAGRVVDGLTAGNLTVAQAYIADHTAPKDRARSFALIGIAFGLGFMLGPALGGALAHYSMSLPFYVAAGFSATSIACTATLLPRDRRDRVAPSGDALPGGRRLSVFDVDQYVAYFKRPILGFVLGEFFLYLFAFSMFNAGFALLAERLYTWQGHAFHAREIGFVFALAGLVGATVQGGLLGRLVARLGERSLVPLGLVCLGAGYVLLGYVRPIAPLALATVVAAFGNSLLRPCLTSIVTQVSSREEQGVVLGLTQTLSSLATLGAAPLSGWLIGRAHLVLWGWVAGGFCAAALIAGRWGSRLVAHTPAPIAQESEL